jgi:hypothetical protein
MHIAYVPNKLSGYAVDHRSNVDTVVKVNAVVDPGWVAFPRSTLYFRCNPAAMTSVLRLTTAHKTGRGVV